MPSRREATLPKDSPARRLRTFRDAFGWSQLTLSAKTGIPQPVISMYENSRCIVSPRHRVVLGNIFHTPPEQFEGKALYNGVVWIKREVPPQDKETIEAFLALAEEHRQIIRDLIQMIDNPNLIDLEGLPGLLGVNESEKE